MAGSRASDIHRDRREAGTSPAHLRGFSKARFRSLGLQCHWGSVHSEMDRLQAARVPFLCGSKAVCVYF